MQLYYKPGPSPTRRPQLELLAAVLLLSLPALAQSPASLRGTVTDSLSGQPLPGVRVAPVGQPGGTTTDALGQFRLRHLRPGAVGVQMSGLGYRVKQQAITLVAGEACGLALALATASLNLAEVTASQPRDLNQTLAAISHID